MKRHGSGGNAWGQSGTARLAAVGRCGTTLGSYAGFTRGPDAASMAAPGGLKGRIGQTVLASPTLGPIALAAACVDGPYLP